MKSYHRFKRRGALIRKVYEMWGPLPAGKAGALVEELTWESETLDLIIKYLNSRMSVPLGSDKTLDRVRNILYNEEYHVY